MAESSKVTGTLNPYIAVGITIGVLAGLWTWLSVETGLITWVAFVSWALFFAAGGTHAAVLKVVPAALSGALYGAILLAVVGAIGGSLALPLGIVVVAFVMCVQANWGVLAYIPAAFAGCASLFGGAGDWGGVAIALLLGTLFGWASEATAGVLTRPRAKAARVRREGVASVESGTPERAGVGSEPRDRATRAASPRRADLQDTAPRFLTPRESGSPLSAGDRIIEEPPSTSTRRNP